MHTVLTSTANPKVKQALALHKSRERRQSGLFLIEGAKEIAMALSHGYEIRTLFWCEELDRESVLAGWLQGKVAPSIVFPVTTAVFDKIAYRDDRDGLLAVAHTKLHGLQNLSDRDNPLYFVLESVEKPGNLGAILRTADAVGAQVIIADGRTDLYNPNVIRSSVGCFFTVEVAITDNSTCLTWLREKGIHTIATAINTDRWHFQADWRRPAAIVLGTEATGLSPFWLSHCDEIVKIPMLGANDSLNVSVAAGIVAYEAIRQRMELP